MNKRMKARYSKFLCVFSASMLLGLSLQLNAAPIDDARSLINVGNYEEAATSLRKIVKSRPRDAAANYLLGLALLKSGQESEGLKYLNTAETRGSADAARLLARYYFDSYEPTEAQEHLDSWQSILRKAKKSAPAELTEMSSRAVAMENMLLRVEKIEIIDTLRVDSVDFFNHYRLSAHAGTLSPGAALASQPGATLVFVPERRSEMFWAAPDSSGRSAVYSSAILDDGTVEHPQLAELTDEDANVSYPFLMPDGMTLYYAADEGPDGLGGFDIYMTRRNDDGSYMQSQNLGMPYNSPFNDFMLAIDETTGLGWWASDREQIPGIVTIYVYAPSETRVNYDSDIDNIAELARLSDISHTRNPDKDYKALLAGKLERIQAEAERNEAGSTPAFELDMGARGVYTSLSDFRSEDARRAMLRYLAAEAQMRKDYERLQSLRDSYSSGKKSGAVSEQILELEKRVEQTRRSQSAARNAIVRLEK